MLSSELLTNLLSVVLFIAFGTVFAIIPLIIARLIVAPGTGAKRDETYESGMETIGSAWVQFSAAFYIYALLFLAFDVDVLYLFPVALAYGQYVIRDFVEVVLFIGILSLAIVYAWSKGVFEWRPKE